MSNESPISLEDFARMNDEIAAMVRAGMPLHAGLQDLARSGSGQMQSLAQEIFSSLEAGDTFPETIAGQPSRYPRMYAAMVEAGIESGRLEASLEAVSDYAWDMVDIRREVGRAMLYPLFVLLLAWGLFVLFILRMLGNILSTLKTVGAVQDGWAAFLHSVADSVHVWGWVPPAVLVLVVLIWCLSQRATSLDLSGGFRLLRLIPGMTTVARNYGHYSFCRLLSLMSEQSVPLDRGLKLAAGTTANVRLESGAADFVQSLERGEDFSVQKTRYSGMPPFLQWVIHQGQHSGTLTRSLNNAAEIYRRRAENYVLWLRYGFPVLAAVVIGGGATLLYALTLFVPLIDLMESMAQEF